MLTTLRFMYFELLDRLTWIVVSTIAGDYVPTWLFRMCVSYQGKLGN